MDADGLPIVGPGIDYTKVGAINQKRTVAFLNHFITHTASFLNRFSVVCEEKLSQLSVRLQRLEVTMSILEAKLNSVPGLENVTVAATPEASTTESTPQQQTATSTNLEPTAPSSQPKEEEPVVETAPEKPQMTVSQDPRYMKYFKMLNMGVPDGALRQRMVIDGLDPNMIDTPNAPVPDQGGSAQARESGSDLSDDEVKQDSSSSEADFSD